MQSNNGVLQVLKIPQQNACVRVSVSKKESQAVIYKAICNMKIQLLLFENYLHSSSTLSFKNNRTYSKK